MKLVCIGDSLTFAPGVRKAQRWTELAAETSGWDIINLGVNGDTTSGMLARLRSQLLDSPGVRSSELFSLSVLIMGGGNDIFFAGSDITARTNISAMVHELSACGARPIVGIPQLPGTCGYPEKWQTLVDFSDATAKIAEYQKWLERFCRAFDIYTVDFRTDFIDSSGNARDELYLDGLHPNTDGQELMAKRLSALLNRLEQEA